MHTYLYDSESHILKVDGTAQYIYGGAGRRIKKLSDSLKFARVGDAVQSGEV